MIVYVSEICILLYYQSCMLYVNEVFYIQGRNMNDNNENSLYMSDPTIVVSCL